MKARQKKNRVNSSKQKKAEGNLGSSQNRSQYLAKKTQQNMFVLWTGGLKNDVNSRKGGITISDYPQLKL